MVKLLAFFRRKEGLSVQGFQKHWRGEHAELVVRQAGLRRYVQNHTLESAYQRRDPVYDGVAEAWFDDTESMRALAESPEYRAVREDESRFIDPSSMGVLLTDEVVVVDGPESEVKMITFLNKRTDVTPDFFQHHWRENHGPLAARIPGLLRYVQCHARPGIYAAGRSPAFDGIPISWFEDMQSLRESGKSAAYRQTRADEENFMISGRLPFVITRTHEIEVR